MLRSKKYERWKKWTPARAKVCVICGKEYMPVASRQKTCAPRCRQKLHSLSARIRRGSDEKLPQAPRVQRSLAYVRVRMIETRAMRAKLPFTLTEAWWSSQWNAQQGRCALTGFPMKMKAEKGDPWLVSVDRIEPKQGYVPDNCRLVCFRANETKGSMNDVEFRVWLEALLHGLDWREGRLCR